MQRWVKPKGSFAHVLRIVWQRNGPTKKYLIRNPAPMSKFQFVAKLSKSKAKTDRKTVAPNLGAGRSTANLGAGRSTANLGGGRSTVNLGAGRSTTNLGGGRSTTNLGTDAALDAGDEGAGSGGKVFFAPKAVSFQHGNLLFMLSRDDTFGSSH